MNKKIISLILIGILTLTLTGWTNANISLKNGVIVITPDYSSLFTND